MPILSLAPEERLRIHAALLFYVNRLKERPTVAEVARRAAIGEAKLVDYCHAIYGLPVQRFFHLARLRTAQTLLRNTAQPIKAVAQKCGYSHYKNFLTAYRHEFQRTPGEERGRMTDEG